MRRRTLGLVAGLLVAFCIGSVQAKVPRKLLGKTFFTTAQIKDQSPAALGRAFEKQRPKAEVTRGKDKHWTCTMVSFFRKASMPGPITIWIYDRADKAAFKAKEPVDAKSVDRTPTDLFVYDLVLSPDVGFNKDRTYLVQVGQILGKRHKVYAQGEVSLKP